MSDDSFMANSNRRRTEAPATSAAKRRSAVWVMLPRSLTSSLHLDLRRAFHQDLVLVICKYDLAGHPNPFPLVMGSRVIDLQWPEPHKVCFRDDHRQVLLVLIVVLRIEVEDMLFHLML